MLRGSKSHNGGLEGVTTADLSVIKRWKKLMNNKTGMAVCFS